MPKAIINYCQFLCLLLLLSFVSCKADVVKPQQQSNTVVQSRESFDLKSPFSTKFGIYFNDTGKAEEGNLLDVKYERMSVVLTQYGGVFQAMNWLEDSGFQVLVTVNYYPANKKSAFVTDTNAYRTSFSGFINNYHPEVAVIENEENNKSYHTGNPQNYFNELAIATRLAHAQGIKVTNGGLTTRALTYLVYEYYIQNNKPDSAASFASRTIPFEEMRAIENRVPNSTMDKNIIYDSLFVAAYKNIPLDYINIHFYEPVIYQSTKTATSVIDSVNQATPGALQEIASYLQRVTGKPVICNEMGQINNSPSLVTGMLQNVLNAQLAYNIWFDYNGSNGAVGLTNNGVLKRNGVAFEKFMASH